MTFNLIAEHRKHAGLTQKQVGDSLGFSSQAVSKWENGQAEPDIDTLYKLAELFGVTVDELVGKETKQEQDAQGDAAATENATSAPVNFFLKYKKKIIIGAVAALALAAVVITIVLIAGAVNKNKLLRGFDKIELGMTMDEVRDILGEPEDTLAKYYDEDDYFAAAMAYGEYGYVNADFWYYRGKEYDDNLRAEERWDLDYEFKEYYQIRITFDEDGKVIEAYLNAKTHYMSVLDDYGTGDYKTVESIEYLDGKHSYDEENEKVKMTFEDGSKYLGEVDLLRYNHTQYADIPWIEIPEDAE